MKRNLPAPPAWKEAWSSGDERLDEKRQKALLALARTHEMAAAGLSGKALKSLQTDALDYVDACLKFEELYHRAEGSADAPVRTAKIERWRDGSRQALADGTFFAFTSGWWLDYLGRPDAG